MQLNMVWKRSTSPRTDLEPTKIHAAITYKGTCNESWQLFQNTVCFPLFAGFPVTEEQLEEVATEAGVLNVPDDFLTPEFRAECERIIPDNDRIKSDECKDAYLYLKHNFTLSV